jgi:NAD(P)-dependent dehydrogenase (short-subunit alcohol dehydrogenase family)
MNCPPSAPVDPVEIGKDILRCFSAKALDGDVAVVTGGGSGIGYSIARDLARCGADVVITSRSVARLESAALRLAEDTDRLCGSLPCDVRETADVDRLRDYVLSRYGRLTILVNNAAANFFVRAERMTQRAFHSVVDTDLFGTFNVTRAFAPDMIAAGRGSILNITIALPERGFPGFAHCGAAKAAIVSLTASWAYEWGRHGIRVNSIGPGPIPTEGAATNMLAKDETSQAFGWLRDSTPLRRLGTPDDVSAAAVFLSSPAASWVTGINVVVDGGGSLNRSPADNF